LNYGANGGAKLKKYLMMNTGNETLYGFSPLV